MSWDDGDEEGPIDDNEDLKNEGDQGWTDHLTDDGGENGGTWEGLGVGQQKKRRRRRVVRKKRRGGRRGEEGGDDEDEDEDRAVAVGRRLGVGTGVGTDDEEAMAGAARGGPRAPEPRGVLTVLRAAVR